VKIHIMLFMSYSQVLNTIQNMCVVSLMISCIMGQHAIPLSDIASKNINNSS